MTLAHNLFLENLEIIDIVENRTYSSDQIHNYTNYLKHQIFDRLNGDTLSRIVYIDTNNFFIVVCAMKAVWELGASIFLNDSHPKVRSLPYFKKFYDVIDLVVGNNQNQDFLPEKYLLTNNFKRHDEHLVKKFDKIIDVGPDFIAFYTTSSGTTDDPKLLKFSHYQTVTISNQIKQYLNLDQQTRPYHFKTLHHNSLFASFALPMLSVCKTHYCGLLQSNEKDFIRDIVSIIKKYKTNFLLIPYSWIRFFHDVESDDFDNEVTLITIMGNTSDEMKDLFDRFNPKQVINYFGCSEVGTMFVSRTTQKNLVEYNPNRFHDIMPYIDYRLFENTVECKWKHTDQWFVLADKITQQGQDIWHWGRSTVFTVNSQQVLIQDLVEFIQNQIGSRQFVLVPDYVRQQLYLALFERNLFQSEIIDLNNNIHKEFSKEFLISDFFCFDPSELLFGMKISSPLLLHLFRERADKK